MIPSDLPPWDALAYFFSPKETLFTSCTLGKQIVPANPTREYLILSVGGQTTVWVTTQPTAQNQQGIQLSAGSPVIALSRGVHGPLVNAAWYFGGTVLTTFTATEILLATWPNGAVKGRLDTVDPGPIRPPARIDSGPGVNGKRGILDYWYRLVSRMTGGGKV